MSKIDGGPAFPETSHCTNGDFYEDRPGMTMRDYFAGFAMQGLIVADTQWTLNPKDLATMAYERADAMLKERQNILPQP